MPLEACRKAPSPSKASLRHKETILYADSVRQTVENYRFRRPNHQVHAVGHTLTEGLRASTANGGEVAAVGRLSELHIDVIYVQMNVRENERGADREKGVKGLLQAEREGGRARRVVFLPPSDMKTLKILELPESDDDECH